VPAIPPFVLKRLYVQGSLQAEDDGFALELKNLVAPGTIISFRGLDADGRAIDAAQVTVIPSGDDPRPASEISDQSPLYFPAGATVRLVVAGTPLAPGPHELAIRVVVRDVGPLEIPVSDALG